MGCPYLIGRQIKMCGAFKAMLVLNVEELDNRCNTGTFQVCKVYQKHVKEGVKIPLKEYETNYRTPQA
jgi:hypothetical protein